MLPKLQSHKQTLEPLEIVLSNKKRWFFLPSFFLGSLAYSWWLERIKRSVSHKEEHAQLDQEEEKSETDFHTHKDISCDAKKQSKRSLFCTGVAPSAPAQSGFPPPITWPARVGEILSWSWKSICSLTPPAQPVRHVLITTGTTAVL